MALKKWACNYSSAFFFKATLSLPAKRECSPKQPFFIFMLTLIIFCVAFVYKGIFSFSDASVLGVLAIQKDYKNCKNDLHSCMKFNTL